MDSSYNCVTYVAFNFFLLVLQKLLENNLMMNHITGNSHISHDFYFDEASWQMLGISMAACGSRVPSCRTQTFAQNLKT